jgi:hypothetical protein
MPIDPSLDELYRMVAYIYGDKNLNRTSTATFTHFVEVCGMLTIHDRKKKREGVDVTDALCKALGWYFPLLAKMKIRSVEELVFRKFPNVCPYCRSAPHNEVQCKLVKGTQPTVDHSALEDLFKKNWNNRPKTLDQWQGMFQNIYPRQLEEHGRSTIGLLEELGEAAEAVRVFEQHPRYFLGEAADLFSYIMGIANEHAVKLAQQEKEFSFGKEFLLRYPGLCPQCGSRVCVCPSVPEATVGRMAKELGIRDDERPFIEDLSKFFELGAAVGHTVLEGVGGYAGLTSQLPFDRGDANRALVSICLRVAEAVETSRPEMASGFRAEAYRISTNAQRLGSPRTNLDVAKLLEQLSTTWKELDEQWRDGIKNEKGLIGDIGEILDTTRVLFVHCCPNDQDNIRVTAEHRAINEAIRRSGRKNSIVLDTLPAATPQDLRRKLLDNSYDIIHFAGHGDEDNLVFEDETGKSANVPLTAIAELVCNRPNIKCVILNACDAGKKLTLPISKCTIAMVDSIDDTAAIEFSRGFYDAIAAGKNVQNAFDEGRLSVKMANQDTGHIKYITI